MVEHYNRWREHVDLSGSSCTIVGGRASRRAESQASIQLGQSLALPESRKANERSGEHLDVGVPGQCQAADRLARVKRERVFVDMEPSGLFLSAGRVAIVGRECRRLPGVPLRRGPAADRLLEPRRRPVRVGHGEGSICLLAIDGGRQQLQRGVIARRQIDGLPRGTDDIGDAGGPEVEGGAVGGQAGPEQGWTRGHAPGRRARPRGIWSRRPRSPSG